MRIRKGPNRLLELVVDGYFQALSEEEIAEMVRIRKRVNIRRNLWRKKMRAERKRAK